MKEDSQTVLQQRVETAAKKNHAVTELITDPPGQPSPDSETLRGVRALWFRLTHWETWDWRIKYLLIGPAWLWCCLRARSAWFFTASNPTLTFGGFDGESKREMYEQLPVGTYPKSIFISPLMPDHEVQRLVDVHGFSFPFAVKPDSGKMGFMFRKITSPEDLKKYHHRIGCDYIIQEWVSYPVEVSVFYYRLPQAKKGIITGFVRKDFLEVIGDGRSTVWDLILKYPRARFRLDEMKSKHAGRLTHVLAQGERYCLSPALNLSRGGRLVSLEHEKDERLLKVFDTLSRAAGGFHYGRYDVKCSSIEDLKEGRNFSVLEYNGSGAEPHHVYGNGYSLWEACSILVAHWNILCLISRENHRAGIPYWEFLKGWRFLINAGKHQKRLRRIDSENALD